MGAMANLYQFLHGCAVPLPWNADGAVPDVCGGVSRASAGEEVVGVEGDGVDRPAVATVPEKNVGTVHVPHTSCAVWGGGGGGGGGGGEGGKHHRAYIVYNYRETP